MTKPLPPPRARTCTWRPRVPSGTVTYTSTVFALSCWNLPQLSTAPFESSIGVLTSAVIAISVGALALTLSPAGERARAGHTAARREEDVVSRDKCNLRRGRLSLPPDPYG